MSTSPLPLAPFLLQVHQLCGGPDGVAVIRDLSHGWPAGLHGVCGDEGSGKTSLLRLLAGDWPAHSGSVLQAPGLVFFADLKGSEHDHTRVDECWAQLQTRFPAWDQELLDDLSQALDMERHRAKPLYMLSTGSRRKVMLVAALASGATVTLLDQPFVSLDQVSVRVIKSFLCEAAQSRDRAWLLADYEMPADLPVASVLYLP